MDRFQLDFGFLNAVVNPDTSRVPYKGNEDKFVRVAFDLFKTKDNSCEDLWQVQADDDGNEYLVRTYDVEDAVVEADWSVALDKMAANLTVSYKGMPIHRLAAADYDAHNERDALLLRVRPEGRALEDHLPQQALERGRPRVLRALGGRARAARQHPRRRRRDQRPDRDGQPDRVLGRERNTDRQPRQCTTLHRPRAPHQGTLTVPSTRECRAGPCDPC